MEEAFFHRWCQLQTPGLRVAIWLSAVIDVIRAMPREWWRSIRSKREPARRARRQALPRLEGWLYDMCHALRLACQEPVYSVRIVLLLAVALGVTIGLASVVDNVLWRGAPGVGQPEGAVYLVSGETSVSFSYLDIKDLVTSEAFDGLAAFLPVTADLSKGSITRRVRAELVSPGFFSILRAEPVIGRLALDEDQESVVIDYSLWRSELGSEPGAVGSTLDINGRPFTVVGVAPPGFKGIGLGPGTNVWINAQHAPLFLPSMGRGVLTRRGWRLFHAVGRLAENVEFEQARAALGTAARQLDEAHPTSGEPRDFRIAPLTLRGLPFEEIGAVRRYAALLIAVGSLVLGVACVNVVGLLGIRDLARRRDRAVRFALGASRWRLLRLRLLECAFLASAGGAAGVALAWWSLPLSSQLELPFGARPASVLDLRTVLIAAGVTGLAAVVFALASGIASATGLDNALREGYSTSRSWSRAGGAAVLVQVALSVTLLVGAGLLLRTLSKLSSVPRGFSAEGVLVASLQPDLQGYDKESGRALLGTILDRAVAIPGVQAASVSSELPLRSENRRMGIWIEGREGEPDIGVDQSVIAPDYFRALSVPLHRGRDFAAGDSSNAPPVVIVNESFVQHFWPGEPIESAVGRRLSVSGPAGPFAEIVGVVANHRHQSLREPATPHLFWSLGQVYSLMTGTTKVLLLRTLREPTALASEVRGILHELDPNLPLHSIATLASVVDDSYRIERQLSFLLAVLGAAAVAVTLIGLHGMIGYALERRTREVAIRIAVGARPKDVSRLFLVNGLSVVLGGVVLGLSVSLLSTRYLSHYLYDLSSTDPLTWIGVASMTLAAGWCASYLPARRASRIDPCAAVRSE